MMGRFSPREKLTKARAQLFRDRPFYGSLAMYMEFKENEDIPTIGVEEGGKLHYNSDFLDQQSDIQEVQFVLMHEVLHLAMNTFGRAKGHEKRVINKETGAVTTLWNVASDYAVNDILDQENFKAPDIVLLEDRFRNKSAEEIYNILDDEIEEQTEMPMACPDSHMEKEGDEKKQRKYRENEEKEWASRMAQAHKQAGEHKKGDYPAQLKEMIDEIVDPKLDWRTLLNQYISHELVKDVSFRRPAKKSFAIGAYLPQVQRENLEITIAIDTSGSISTDLLALFLAEVKGILHSYESVSMDLILADADIHEVHELKHYDIYEVDDIEIVGRGGTDHRPVFKWVDKNKPETQILVCLTDGYTDFPDQEGSWDTLWVVPEDGAEPSKFPFGQVIRVDEDYG